jgi:hypothetical protein
MHEAAGLHGLLMRHTGRELSRRIEAVRGSARMVSSPAGCRKVRQQKRVTDQGFEVREFHGTLARVVVFALPTYSRPRTPDP